MTGRHRLEAETREVPSSLTGPLLVLALMAAFGLAVLLII